MNIQIREQILNLLLQNIDQMSKIIEGLQKENAELQKQLTEVKDGKSGRPS